ncbi:hypothetical protein EI94DRAFT_1707802 [Lactarius quietus]|nr:hypothetical protein EI94DRAFT_1707802 [Lactarius quietus]
MCTLHQHSSLSQHVRILRSLLALAKETDLFPPFPPTQHWRLRGSLIAAACRFRPGLWDTPTAAPTVSAAPNHLQCNPWNSRDLRFLDNDPPHIQANSSFRMGPQHGYRALSSAYPLGSVGARLEPTLKEALRVRDGATWQAKWTAYSINIAIALQVVLGALTTALGASLRGSSISISIAVLGSLATLVASYLARTRGSSEPETSLLRKQALNNFIRRLRSFILDTGLQDGHDQVVENFRNELERLLNPSDPNAKKNPLLFEPKVEIEGRLKSQTVVRRARTERSTALGETGARMKTETWTKTRMTTQDKKKKPDELGTGAVPSSRLRARQASKDMPGS